MADPGAEAVMIRGIEHSHARAHPLHALDELSAKARVRILAGKRRKQPGCAFEQIGVGELDARELLARHGMSGEETLSGSAAERLGGARHDFGFCAANIGDERTRGQRRPEAFDQIENSDNWRRENDEIAAVDGVREVG